MPTSGLPRLDPQFLAQDCIFISTLGGFIEFPYRQAYTHLRLPSITCVDGYRFRL